MVLLVSGPLLVVLGSLAWARAGWPRWLMLLGWLLVGMAGLAGCAASWPFLWPLCSARLGLPLGQLLWVGASGLSLVLGLVEMSSALCEAPWRTSLLARRCVLATTVVGAAISLWGHAELLPMLCAPTAALSLGLLGLSVAMEVSS